MEKYIRRSFVTILVMAAVLCAAGKKIPMNYSAVYQTVAQASGSKNTNVSYVGTTIVVDAGHGGIDSGKVGVHGALEKELNLSIAKKLKRNLENVGFKVIMTRTDDDGLYKAGSKNKKREDMNARVKIINESGALLAVSVHQNSFTDGRYSGAQVFYYKASEEGKHLAETLQKTLVEKVQPENMRQIKANDDYFILKNSDIPVVIAECGFLSNAEEEAKLMDEAYQEKIAWALHLGIMRYINDSNLKNAG